MVNVIKNLLSHPLTRNVDIDDPRCTELRRRILKEKRFLFRLYLEWYRELETMLPPAGKPVVELGAGGSFMKEVIPDVITTEVFYIKNADVIADGTSLCFCDNSLCGIVMTFVLHHIPSPELFFSEACRCLKKGGKIVMLEPWVTPWSKVIYRKLHHEPYSDQERGWEFMTSGPLSGANIALPWIIFQRDRHIFESKFPMLAVKKIMPVSPLCYLLSGGISYRSLLPGFMFPAIWKLEQTMQSCNKYIAMFAFIELEMN